MCMADRGHALNITHAGPKLSLLDIETNEFLYSNVVLFSGGLKSSQYRQFLRFVESGGNLLVAIDGRASSFTRQFLADCGVAVRANSSNLLDYSHFVNFRNDR